MLRCKSFADVDVINIKKEWKRKKNLLAHWFVMTERVKRKVGLGDEQHRSPDLRSYCQIFLLLLLWVLDHLCV